VLVSSSIRVVVTVVSSQGRLEFPTLACNTQTPKCLSRFTAGTVNRGLGISDLDDAVLPPRHQSLRARLKSLGHFHDQRLRNTMNVPGGGNRRVATQSNDLCVISVRLRCKHVRSNLGNCGSGVVHHYQLIPPLQRLDDETKTAAVRESDVGRIEPVDIVLTDEIIVGGEHGCLGEIPLDKRTLPRTGEAAKHLDFTQVLLLETTGYFQATLVFPIISFLMVKDYLAHHELPYLQQCRQTR